MLRRIGGQLINSTHDSIKRYTYTSTLHPKVLALVENKQARYKELNGIFADESGRLNGETITKLNREIVSLGPIVKANEGYVSLIGGYNATEDILAMEDDKEMLSMFTTELEELRRSLNQCEGEILSLLTQAEVSDVDPNYAIVEVKSCAGGSEAGLFAEDVFNMYRHFAEINNWSFKESSVSYMESNGFKDGTAILEGDNVYPRMLYEVGTHRVQRVPKTESAGRVHTSTVMVTILPKASEVELEISPLDLKIETFRASGAGGQHVNTTDSAVRITHVPTNTVAFSQGERSQIQNKATALELLRSRLFLAEQKKLQDERSSLKKSQMGTGERGERIRTYNFPQGRITDHRVNMSLYDVDTFLKGADLDLFHAALEKKAQSDLIEALINE